MRMASVLGELIVSWITVRLFPGLFVVASFAKRSVLELSSLGDIDGFEELEAFGDLLDFQ
jgi:hypothetical protein